MSDLVGKPEYRFSRVAAQIIHVSIKHINTFNKRGAVEH